MGTMAIGIGAALCGSGAVAHFINPSARQEQLFAFGGLCFLVTGAFLG